MLSVLLRILVLGVAADDRLHRRHAILRDFPVLGHFQSLPETVGPERRQCTVTDNEEERPSPTDVAALRSDMGGASR